MNRWKPCSLVAAWLLVINDAEAQFTVAKVPVTGEPRRIAAADLDGDVDIDLFVVQRVDDQTAVLQVLLNQEGQFTLGWRGVEPTIALDVWDVDLGDTDNDGDADVVYVLPFGVPSQRLNDGTGHFAAAAPIPTFSYKFEHELADMNGDGNVDLVYYEPDLFGDLFFGTMKGLGTGVFAWDFTAEVYVVGAMETHRRVALGDVTGDGLRDAAWTAQGGLMLFRGKPPASGSTLPGWLPPQLVASTPCNDVVAVDLDGDERLDLVASAPTLDSVAVIHGLPGGVLGSPQVYPAGPDPDALAADDFDHDGTPDVVVASTTTGTVQLLRGSAGGGLQAPMAIRVGRLPTDLVAADLDGDGDTDVAVTCAVAGHVAVLINAAVQERLAVGQHARNLEMNAQAGR